MVPHSVGNDLTLEKMAELTDVFYIGGTKCGALFGEALVITNKKLARKFRTYMKQNGAVLAKGWLLGMQFCALLEDHKQLVGIAVHIFPDPFFFKCSLDLQSIGICLGCHFFVSIIL